MKLWLTKNNAVPLREQLITQITLGITSNDLQPGQKLPSTRELARRFSVHPNTISAAYRELARQGWVELRRGSGVYVLTPKSKTPAWDDELRLDALTSVFIHAAREQGFTLDAIKERVLNQLNAQPPDHFLVVEPDAELRRILVTEIVAATKFRVVGATLEAVLASDFLTGAAPVALYSQAESVRAALPANAQLLLLHSHSIAESLKWEKQPPPDALISVVSHWQGFMRWSRAILVAAGVDPDALNFHDARRKNWRAGLRASSLVITDSLTAANVPARTPTRVFHIISEASLDMLREFIRRL